MNVDTGHLMGVSEMSESEKRQLEYEGYEGVPAKHELEASARLLKQPQFGQEETKDGDVHMNWLDKKSGLTRWGHKKRKIKERLKANK